MTTDRSAFELAVIELGFDSTKNKHSMNEYADYDTHCAWLGWQAAKESSEQRIAELEATVNELRWMQGVNTDATTQELKSHVNRLREALEDECGNRCNAEYNPCWARQLLAETPAQSLKAHDNELIDKCVQAIINVGGKRVWEFVDAVKTINSK